GTLDIAVNEKSELWSGYRMARFVAVEKFQVRGFLNRYRQAGIGAPLAAELEAARQGPEAEAARKRVPPPLKGPVTAVLRLDNVAEGIASGRIQGEIEIYTAEAADTVDIAGRRMPLQLEPTAALAYQLEDSPIWDTELGSFLSALRPPSPESLVMLHPYRPGRVPVVLVHGTASSPAPSAAILNHLPNHPNLHTPTPFSPFTSTPP